MADWRDKVDLALREHLEAQIKESNMYKEAYEKASNQGNAQLWVAIAVLSKQVFKLNQKLRVVEDAIKDVGSNVRESIGKIEEVQTKVAEVKEVSEKAVKDTPKKIVRKVAKKVVKKKAVVRKKPARKGISRALKKF